ncbi:MAG: hypothetical protein BalsKO_14100 [Balneolaceae bacterium]
MRITSLLILASLISATTIAQTVHGDLMIWHKVVIDFEGPMASEFSKPNPFTDYRLDVTFTGPSNQSYKVAGFYAADGNAGETSSDSGSVWRVYFTPDEIGNWSFEASFVSGTQIAAEFEGGESAGFFDGTTGNFQISTASDLLETDFRSKGKLTYVGDHYLQFQGSKDYFLKVGANSPEVFLEYSGFDNTPSSRTYPNHIQDYTEGDSVSTWKNGEGKGILGAINYLSDLKVNALYFLTMNAYGDGKNAWPWIHQDSIFVYDVSKLDQWEYVFEHMTKKGVMPHFVLTETENESFFELVEDGSTGGFATSRKIYYREMVARFGHHPALTWNIGEENGWEDPSSSDYKKGNTDQQRIDAANYLRALTYFDDHITIHNGPSDDDHIYDGLLGIKSHTGPAFQWNFGSGIHSKVVEWREKSAASGHNWVVNMDEAWISGATGGLTTWKKDISWGTFMGGGAGVELYIGAGLDLQVQDFREYEEFYSISVKIMDYFIDNNIPVHKMSPADSLASRAWVLAQPDSTYLMYLLGGGSDLILPEGIYNIEWYDPSTNEYVPEAAEQVIGGDVVRIGPGPVRRLGDSVALITKTDSLTSSSELEIDKPKGFNLDQNYPNPFNPSTQIPFSVSEPAFITLTVYDALGREVETIVNEFKNPNKYQVLFDSKNLSSGMYYYRLTSDKFEGATKKMMLLK